MKIGFGGLQLHYENSYFSTGLNRYASQLLSALEKVDRKNSYSVFTGKDSYKRLNFTNENFRKIEMPCQANKRPSRIFAEQFVLPLKIRKLDIYHGPTNVIPLVAKIPSVVTIQDMMVWAAPETQQLRRKWYFKFVMKKSIQNASKLIAPSENTKKDIIKYAKVKPDKIEVIPLAAEERFHKAAVSDAIRNKYGLPEQFILSVGVLQPRKNLARLLQAYSKIKDKIPHKLVIAGAKGWKHNAIFETIQNLGLQKHVIHIGFADDNDLPALYATADLFAYPSIYEGFGLPPLEAMASGCPVVTSNTSSLPEVVGDAALKVNPHNTNELAEAIKCAVTDIGLRNSLAKAGKKQAKKFSWQKTAKQTLNVYTEVFESSHNKQGGHSKN